jgi:hypothetical protein
MYRTQLSQFGIVIPYVILGFPFVSSFASPVISIHVPVVSDFFRLASAPRDPRLPEARL